jgi:hypothetical protein
MESVSCQLLLSKVTVMAIWRIKTPLDVTFLRHLQLPTPEDKYKTKRWITMDEEFVAVFEKHFDRDAHTIYLVSTTTLEIVTSLSAHNCTARYESGLLVLHSKKDIR